MHEAYTSIRMKHVRLACAVIACVLLPVAGRAERYEETENKPSWFSWVRPAYQTPADELWYADELRAEGALRAAARHYRALALTWPGSKQAPVAQMKLAEITAERGDEEKSFDHYQVLMEKFYGQFPHQEVLERQMDLAVKIANRRRLAWFGLPGIQAPERAIPFLEKVLVNGPAAPRAAEAQFRIAEAYEHSAQEDLAVGAYQRLEERYPKSAFAEQAALGRARSWHALARQSPNDEATQQEAFAACAAFRNRFPSSVSGETVALFQRELYERMAQQAHDRAHFYDRTARKPGAALRAYETLLRDYPASSLARESSNRVAVLRVMTAKEKSDAP